MISAETLHDIVNYDDDFDCENLAECFRSLRNTCAVDLSVQNSLATDTMAVGDTCKVFQRILSKPKYEDGTLVLRLGVQFLGNLIVNNEVNQQIVWSQCSTVLRELISFGDQKLTNYCMMVIFNILLGSPGVMKDFINDISLVKLICQNASDGSEFALYTIEHLVIQDGFKELYEAATLEERLFFLEALIEAVKRADKKIPVATVRFLAEEFRLRSDCILKTVSDYANSLEPEEVAKLLEFLASSSSDSPYLEALQEDTSLFINCAFLLKSIHSAGKEGDNCFSAIQKLSEVTNEKTDLQTHPAFGFKANLIRVLGNLCWKCKKIQNMMKELDCIPVLLDCCNIDARNPFIIQCVVFAVRNLCEGNLENQSIIANMNKEGVVSSALLAELGVTLHADTENNQIKIAPLKR